MLSAAKHLGATGLRTPCRVGMLLLCAVLVSWLAACSSASTAPVVKIGLVAPFEGRYRAVGYEAIYAARLAIREVNQAGGIAGFRVALTALDDGGDPDMAIEQARKLAIDPQVVAVVGHFRADTTDAAIDAYCGERLALLAVEATRSGVCPALFVLSPAPESDPFPSDPASYLFYATVPHPADVPKARAFVEAYDAIPIDGTRAGPIALQTYDAMYVLFDALKRNVQGEGRSLRQGMAQALAASNFSGLAGEYRFVTGGNRVGVKIHAFRYSRDREPELIR